MSNVLVIHFVAVYLLLMHLARNVWNIVLFNSLILQPIMFWLMFLIRPFQVADAVDVIK